MSGDWAPNLGVTSPTVGLLPPKLGVIAPAVGSGDPRPGLPDVETDVISGLISLPPASLIGREAAS